MAGRRERVGVIVVRVWSEESTGPVRARITHAQDTHSGEQTSELAAGTDEIVARVRAWIEAFAAQAGSQEHGA